MIIELAPFLSDGELLIDLRYFSVNVMVRMIYK